MPDKKLTEELLNELLDAPSIDGYIKEHDFAAPSLSDYLKQLLQEKGLERSRVVRMADLNETFGYQIFTGARHPSRNKVLQIAFAMALSMKETNRALTAAGVSVLNCKDRRDAIIIFCIDRGQILVERDDLDTRRLALALCKLQCHGNFLSSTARTMDGLYTAGVSSVPNRRRLKLRRIYGKRGDKPSVAPALTDVRQQAKNLPLL